MRWYVLALLQIRPPQVRTGSHHFGRLWPSDQRREDGFCAHEIQARIEPIPPSGFVPNLNARSFLPRVDPELYYEANYIIGFVRICP